LFGRIDERWTRRREPRNILLSLRDEVKHFSPSDITNAGCSVIDVADEVEANDWLVSRGLSDGLPVIVPTRERVAAMLEAAPLPASAVLGEVPERRRQMTVVQAAISAVMAGGLPTYFPMIIATWQAVLDPQFNAHGVLSSSGGAAITAVVSGGYGQELGMNSGHNLLGPGNRPNATIGRSIRLGAMLTLDARADVLDASSFGQPGKYTSHFAETDPPGSWLPLRVAAGFAPDATTVTVIATAAPRQVNQSPTASSDELLSTLASAMSDPTQIGTGKSTSYLVVLGPEHAGLLRYMTQDDIRLELSQRSRILAARFLEAGINVERTGGYVSDGHDGFVTVEPDAVLLVCAGGFGAGWSVVFPGWGTRVHSRPVTRRVELMEG
jgi:hypothetical protein